MTKRSRDLVVVQLLAESDREKAMPKETFFNLPEEKRLSIEKAAIDEFVEYNFNSASINRIIEKCGIPKGSFYQYFEDKKDLYKHILKLITNKKIKYMSPELANAENLDFFSLIRELYVAGLNFARDNPRFVSIGNKFLAEKGSGIYEEVISENIAAADNIFDLLLAKGIQKGEIRKNIDVKLVSHLISGLNVSIIDYYMKDSAGGFDEGIIELADKFLNFIQFGIGTKPEEVM